MAEDLLSSIISLLASLALAGILAHVIFNGDGPTAVTSKKSKKTKKKRQPEEGLKLSSDIDIPIEILLKDVLPMLPLRSDWNNLSMVNKATYRFFKSQKDLLPPWPKECMWPQDPVFVSDALRAHARAGYRRLPEYLKHQKSSNAVWSRDGTQIASLGNSYQFWMTGRSLQIHVVDQKLGHVKKWEAHGGRDICSIDFGDKFLVSSGLDCVVKKWGRKRNRYDCVAEWDHLIPKEDYEFEEGYIVRRDNEVMFPLRVAPDSSTIVMMIRYRALIFNAADGVVSHSIQLAGYHATAQPLFFPDGKSIALGCDDELPNSRGCIKVWRRADNSVQTKVLPEPVREVGIIYSTFVSVSDFAISSDGLTLVCCSETVALIWRVEEEGLSLKGKLHTHYLHDMKSVAFLPDEAYVVVAGEERNDYDHVGFATFYRLADQSCSSSYTFSGPVDSIRYSPSGIGLYVSEGKATINFDLDVEDDSDDNEDEDEEYQPRTGPLVFDFVTGEMTR